MAFIHRDTFKIYNRSKIGDNDIDDIGAFFEVDDLIAPVISKLNIRGYTTKYCCQGHPYRILDDDMFTIHPNEMATDAIRRKMNCDHIEVSHMIPISANTSYVFYEVDAFPRAYIMFEEGVKLPTIPKGWYVDNDYNQLTIEKIYNIPSSPIMFFSELVADIDYLLKFVEKLPLCTTSIDGDWNDCASELVSKLPSITDVESSMIRKLYSEGKEPDQILNALVNFNRK